MIVWSKTTFVPGRVGCWRGGAAASFDFLVDIAAELPMQ